MWLQNRRERFVAIKSIFEKIWKKGNKRVFNMKNGYLESIFESYILTILAKKLTIDKPRFIKDD